MYYILCNFGLFIFQNSLYYWAHAKDHVKCSRWWLSACLAYSFLTVDEHVTLSIQILICVFTNGKVGGVGGKECTRNCKKYHHAKSSSNPPQYMSPEMYTACIFKTISIPIMYLDLEMDKYTDCINCQLHYEYTP